VAKFIRKHKIQIIHSHSRRAHWVAAQAARLTGIAHVTTIHQQLPVHFFSRMFPCLGDAAIAVDEVVAEHTRSHFSIPSKNVHLIRNGIPLADYSPPARDTPGQKKVLLIGRLSGGRWNALQFFLKTMETSQLPPALYQIAGRVPDERRETLLNQLSVLNSRLAPTRIELLGFVKDLAVTIRNADVVVAAGRSALESLANARPVVILGEGGTLGLCQPATWPSALKTNFADHLAPPQFDSEKLEGGLRDILMPRGSLNELIRWGRAQVETYYDLAKIAPQIEKIYEDVKR
jgi:glycosyltransferase involved in cell wall biosynthesis